MAWSDFGDILSNGLSKTVDGVIEKEFGSTKETVIIDRIPPKIENPQTPDISVAGAKEQQSSSQLIAGVDDKLVIAGGVVLLLVLGGKLL